MSENKFIKHLRGEDTAKSVLEIRNQKTPTSFGNMPEGNTSNANDVYSDHRGDAAGVLKGTENWKLNGSVLLETSSVYGDGRDFTDSFDVDGSVLWVNATHTFATARRFAPNTKFVLKLCGHDLNTVVGDTIGFTLLVKFGTNNIISKVFNITEQAFDFCKEFVIDFGESNASAIKVAAGSTMTVQLLCADPFASATIYNGMTVFTALQRRVDSETVSSDTLSLDEIEYDLTTHINDKNNPHEVTKAQVGLGNCDNTSDLDKPISTATQTALDGKVSTDGSSTMTGPLKMRATSSFQCAIAPFWDGVGFFKLNSDDSVTLIASIETPDGFLPWVTNTYNIGSSLKKWKNLYLAGTAYITKINNGYDLLVPAKSGTLATKEEVDLAANSGRMILDQGVWYAKMYAATVAPAAEDGTNYADFSQVDGQGNPIIVTYNRVNGAWVQDQTITPPADYDGYVSITSKIWDITEQAGQQGGRILWNHQSKEFTPYPQIISYESINVTGDSTVVMPANPTDNSIPSKKYIDDLIANLIANLDVPELFDCKWKDRTTSRTTWALSDGNWVTDKSDAYQHLADDFTNGTRTLVPEGAGIWCYIAPDGHRIVDVSDTTQVQNVIDLYNTTGVAWYYIIDTTNQRFKLPRTKYGFTGIRSGVGAFVEAGLPNITGTATRMFAETNATANGAMMLSDNYGQNNWSNLTINRGWTLSIDASRSSSIYGNSDTVQPKATEMYLYFYVGN